MVPDFENDLLLVTAASGKQASALLLILATKWKHLRLQCVSSQSETRLRETFPSAEIVRSGFASLEEAARLLRGVSYAYLVTPGFHPREAQHGINMIDAAVAQKRAGGPFKFMLYSSVLHPCLRAMANHDNKRFVEEVLVESELPYVILQPTHLMDTVPLKALVDGQRDKAEIVFSARFNPQTKFSFVSCHDLGEAAANVLSDPQEFAFSTFQLVSTKTPISYVEAMDTVSKIAGKPVRIQRMSLEDAVQGFRQSISDDTPQNEVDLMLLNLTRMLAHYESHGLVGNNKALSMLLGRQPLGYEAWIRFQLV